ncbi:hypothetical protein DYU05_00130 [Mucilaginibacter terrenus]|uniref:histidine kinase n=1 Tax=Mucilaginibacter terrenus TaxID=2482727 RepID=A0A3E2NSU2_9SPHI|nr:histidine kinase [Mucilaginibacter terrenus]RFZ84083.1 hypothetical protein DYU05_00130 [Mucilaginibacter terrenus]
MQITTDNAYILIVLGMCGTFLLVTAFILFSVRNQNRLLKQRQRFQHAELVHQKELLRAIIESQETERKRIGQDLHDDVGTTLSGLRLLIEMFKPTDKTDNYYLEFIRSSKATIDKIVTDVRNISHNLSPATLGYYGLAAAIEEHIDVINQSGKLEVIVTDNSGELLNNLELPIATALYRVLEELLNNTIKHSGASRAEIEFRNDENGLSINYNDNGKGIAQAQSTLKKGMGLQNIESRLLNINAAYLISTEPGQGFNVLVKCPITLNDT